jgi:uncharacterized protein
MARPLLLFAPGAGAPSTSPWMERWSRRLAPLGKVVRFDYAYRREGRKAPDRLPKLILAHREALAAARGRGRPPVVLIGKSMGGRVGCHLAVEDGGIAALVCLGYPLVGQNGTVRDEVLVALRAPILFVQGTKDPLCPLSALAEVRARMTKQNVLHVIDGGNHSLEVTKRELGGRTQDDVDAEAFDAIAAFIYGVGAR